MKNILLFLGMFLAWNGNWQLSAQENQAEVVKAKDLQSQINELKEGQQKVLVELAEIKRLLKQNVERSEVNTIPKEPIPSLQTLNVHGEIFRGQKAARVVVMEFSDFECSFCGKYARDVFPKLSKEFIENGKIKYYFRDLPEFGETNSVLKARAARCAGEEGKFWEMHDRLFATQMEKGNRDLLSHASALDLGAVSFNACIHSDRYLQNIQRSAVSAGRLGLRGTPGFAIGTVDESGDFFTVKKTWVGGESYDDLKKAIEEAIGEGK